MAEPNRLDILFLWTLSSSSSSLPSLGRIVGRFCGGDSGLVTFYFDRRLLGCFGTSSDFDLTS